MYRKFNNNSNTSHVESNQDKLEKLLSAIEGTTSSRIDQNYAEVGTAIGQHHLNGCISSTSSSKSSLSHGIYKEPLVNKGQCLINAPVAARHPADPTTTSLLNAPVHRSGFKFPGKHSPSPQNANDSSSQHHAKGLYQNDDVGSILHQRKNQSTSLKTIGPPRTIFADTPEDSTFEVKGTSFEYTGESKNVGHDGNVSSSSLDLIIAALLGLTTTSQVEEVNNSTTAIASNNPFTHKTSALINHDILISNLLQQLSESHVMQSHNICHASLPYNASVHDVPSSDIPLHLSLLLQQNAQKEDIDSEISNNRCSTLFSEYQKLPVLTEHINLALEEQHMNSMQIYQQLLNQVNDIRENYIRMIEQIRLQRQETAATDTSASNESVESLIHRTSTSLTEKRDRDSSTSIDQLEVPKNSSNRKRSNQTSSNHDGSSIINQRKKRKKKRRYKKATHLDDDSTIKTSSPRLESAFKRFNAKFDEFTLSCMEEVGYHGEECDELLPTFQNEVIRECMHRRR